ncbi:MAG: YdbH domain-containing protein [Novosphingobium sp.]|nr:YdbH domain-containing protein [Novosphingobium sp.]
MAEQDDETEQFAEEAVAVPQRRRRGRIVLAIAGVVVALLALVWFTREDIADNIIASQLESLGIPATYKIEQIGPSKQILTDIVVGDPARPNLTVERAEVTIYQPLGLPYIGRVRVVNPRFYGTFHDGKLSFGALDPLLFDKTRTEPISLPRFNLDLEDARGLVETDYGPVGIKAEGHGGLRDGFSGIVAALAPALAGEGCAAGRTSFFGKIAIAGAKPKISGPARLESLACDKAGAALRDAVAGIDLTADESFENVEGTFDLRSAAGHYGDFALTGFNGTGALTLRGDALTARYDSVMRGLQSPVAASPVMTGKGRLRGNVGEGRFEWDAGWEGNGVRLSNRIDAGLGTLVSGSEGTLLAPIFDRIRQSLRREGRGSQLVAQTTLRKTAKGLSLVVPQAGLRGGSGATLLSLSRVQYAAEGNAPVRLSGNFTTGGLGLPQITGRMDRQDGGKAVLRLTMPEYRAGGGSLAVPELLVLQNEAGALGFAGAIRASGALPGGLADGLVLPVSGNWSQQAGLSLWRDCTNLRFDRLVLGGAEFAKDSLTLCPQAGGAIVRSDTRGTRLAARTKGLDLAGKLGGSPVRVRSGAIAFAAPGKLAARDFDVALGPPEEQTHFTLANLDATIGSGIAGHFSGVGMKLFPVPLDVLDASGAWRVEHGALVLSEAKVRVEDREKPGRFEPLEADGANLTLANSTIQADALLRNPTTGREVTRVAIVHDLTTGTGHSDLAVDGLAFDNGLQPDMLSGLALGVIANAKGSVTGTGRIDWDESGVTSSGRFSSKALDFAAAFGPVQGLSGTVTFTDLLGLVTAPDQRLKIVSINPGIEVRNGELSFDMKPGFILDVNGAHWPFMDGRLTLEPTRMKLGEAETRRYTLTVDGLDAAVFVQRLELGNIMATGRFDGSLPLVFDENGGRIEGGHLVSRDPGGNLAYIGELTYKDLSAMGNFAFDALRSINYRSMKIDMDGSLAGEIITRVSFDGLSQGEGASKNFLTRQVAKLPIRFNLNIRAPFFSLFGSFKSLYDPSLVQDPAALGLLDGKNGKKAVSAVQRPVSEAMR